MAANWYLPYDLIGYINIRYLYSSSPKELVDEKD